MNLIVSMAGFLTVLWPNHITVGRNMTWGLMAVRRFNNILLRIIFTTSYSVEDSNFDNVTLLTNQYPKFFICKSYYDYNLLLIPDKSVKDIVISFVRVKT